MGFKNSISLGPVISTANHLLRVCLGVISLLFEKQSPLLCHRFGGRYCIFGFLSTGRLFYRRTEGA